MHPARILHPTVTAASPHRYLFSSPFTLRSLSWPTPPYAALHIIPPSRQNCVGQPTFEKDVSRAFRRSFVGFNMRWIDASWKDFGFRASFLFGILFDEGELHGQVHSLEGECWIMSASMSFHQILFVGPHPFASVPPCTYEDKRSIVAGLPPLCLPT
ncbi:hypothetical protein C8J57DRAFT_1297074 [Mycena rebaudengoi]|nr:hypothetical protein C8J57DRAFT_1297074 [Mycena rebaudengoi]